MKNGRAQGQSGDATEIKQRGLSFAYRIGLKVAAKFPQFRYFNFDLNAGSGFNDDAGCIGSPLTFLSEARVAGCERYFAGFCDRDEAAVRELLARLRDQRCCRVFHGDNAEFLDMVPDIIRLCGERERYAIGSVLSDPNGADVPIEGIAELARICPRIDIIFHWNSTITKRLRYGVKPEQITLEDVPHQVAKDHWLIREPSGPHQFTLLIGRNFRTGDWPSMGFHHLDSPRGQSILERCSVSTRERASRQQGGLFDAAL